MNKTIRANLLLLLAAAIWGLAFVAQVKGSGSLAPFSFNGARMLLSFITLIPFILMRGKKTSGEAKKDIRQEAKAGLICGALLFLGATFQQLGIYLGSGAGKAGFLTTLYIVLVPVLGLFFRKKVRWIVWAAVAVSAVGTYLLCFPQGSTTWEFQPSDIALLMCALSYSGQILAVDHFVEKVDAVRLSWLQFLVAGILSFIAMLLTEHPTGADFMSALLPLMYAGVLSGAVGFTLQTIGQRDTDPAIASLIMCLESVFAALSGFLLLGERMSGRELIGCVLMFGAVLLAQMPERKARR